MPMIYVKVNNFQVYRDSNISYICSRDYRARLLLFGAIEYTTAMDISRIGQVNREPNISCICSRDYRARVLIFGATAMDISRIGQITIAAIARRRGLLDDNVMIALAESS